MKVKEEDGFEWWLTCFYGWPEVNLWYKSWELLQHLKTFVEGPWMCIGDFNAISQSTKKLSKRPPQMSQIDAFPASLEFCHLGDANTKLKFDRAVATKDWRDKF